MTSPRTSHGLRPIYGDTDQMGVVYYANYLRYFEAGRNEHCRQRGIPYREVEADGLMLPVVEARVHYHQPARYDEALRLDTWIESAGRVKVVFAYELWREADDTLIAAGRTVHACVGQGGRPTRLPPSLRERLIAPD